MPATLRIDGKQAWRALIGDKSNIVSVFSIGLAAAACTMVFSLVNSTLLRPPPYPDPGRLLLAWQVSPERPQERKLVSPSLFEEWEQGARSFSSLAAFVSGSDINLDLGGDGGAEKIPAAAVSSEFFATLGIRPQRGRDFNATEQSPDGPLAVLISDQLWRRLGGESAPERIVLSGRSYPVIGALPPGVEFPSGVQVWIPRPRETHKALNLGLDIHPNFGVLGRLRDGATAEQASQELSAITQAALAEATDREASQARVAALSEELAGELGPTLWTLFGAVAFVLLIACVNVASLRLAQVSHRSRQTAVAAALGASRIRLAVAPLLESLFIAMAGCAVGGLLLLATFPVLDALIPQSLHSGAAVKLDWAVLAFALLLLIVVTLAIGLAPAIQTSRQDVNSLLRGQGKTVGPSGRLPRLLATGEVGLALVLLVAAALMIRSLVMFTAMRPGFEPSGAVTLRIAPPAWKYTDEQRRWALYDSLLEAFRAKPGVVAAGAVNLFPLGGGRFPTVVQSLSDSEAQPVQAQADWMAATPGYFAAMGVPLELGRDFEASDSGASEPVAILDRSLAQKLWPDRSPVGNRLSVLGSVHRVVGVSGSIVYRGFGKQETDCIYVSNRQSPLPWPFMTFVVRTDGHAPTLAEEVRQTVASVDKDLAVADLSVLEDQVGETFSNSRFAARLLTVFAGFALLLAAIGIYGTLAGFVSRSSSEIALRMALGATETDTMRLVLGRSLRMTLTGLVLGTLTAALLGRLIAALLFGVEPLDAIAFAVAVATLLAVALLAAWIPARRAMSIHPATVLRSS